jgi:hypothetical protein
LAQSQLFCEIAPSYLSNYPSLPGKEASVYHRKTSYFSKPKRLYLERLHIFLQSGKRFAMQKLVLPLFQGLT